MRVPHSAIRALIGDGVVPQHCVNVELLIPADGRMVLRCDVEVTPELIERVCATLQAVVRMDEPIREVLP